MAKKKKKDLLFKLASVRVQNAECKNAFHKCHFETLKYVTACQMVGYKFQETFTNHLNYIAARPTCQSQRLVSSVIVEELASGPGAPPGILGHMKTFDIGLHHRRPQKPCATAVTTCPGFNRPSQNFT